MQEDNKAQIQHDKEIVDIDKKIKNLKEELKTLKDTKKDDKTIKEKEKELQDAEKRKSDVAEKFEESKQLKILHDQDIDLVQFVRSALDGNAEANAQKKSEDDKLMQSIEAILEQDPRDFNKFIDKVNESLTNIPRQKKSEFVNNASLVMSAFGSGIDAGKALKHGMGFFGGMTAATAFVLAVRALDRSDGGIGALVDKDLLTSSFASNAKLDFEQIFPYILFVLAITAVLAVVVSMVVQGSIAADTAREDIKNKEEFIKEKINVKNALEAINKNPLDPEVFETLKNATNNMIDHSTNSTDPILKAHQINLLETNLLKLESMKEYANIKNSLNKLQENKGDDAIISNTTATKEKNNTVTISHKEFLKNIVFKKSKYINSPNLNPSKLRKQNTPAKQ